MRLHRVLLLILFLPFLLASQPVETRAAMSVSTFQVPTSPLANYDYKILSGEHPAIVHAGADQAADSAHAMSDEIWSQCFCSVFPYFEASTAVYSKSKAFENYMFVSEFNGFGTFAHEWGHMLGLPDLYDTKTQQDYLGYWSLMDSGNWCCHNSQQTTPSSIGGWGAVLLGWLTPIIPATNTVLSDFELKALESSTASVVLIPVSSTTYYFIEYRAGTGPDSQLPLGILVFFVDETLDTGRGILRLVNPNTGLIFPGQDEASNLSGAVYTASTKFSDPTHSVYLIDVGGAGPVTVLYSTQEITGAFRQTSLLTISSAIAARFHDSVSLGGVLVGADSNKLPSQDVELDVQYVRGQWQVVGTTRTEAGGTFSFTFPANYDVGRYGLKLLYPGAKVGAVWYSSSSLSITLQVNPARLVLTLDVPSLATADYVRLTVSTHDAQGNPIAGAMVDVILDGREAGSVTSDENGNAVIRLALGLADLGFHSINATASLPNYSAEEAARTFFVLPPLWLTVLVVGFGAAAPCFVYVYRRNRKPNRS